MENETVPFKTIAVDFDGTLCYSNWPELGQPNTALIAYIQELKRNGNKLILWTCRAGYKMSRPNVQKILYKNVQLVCLS